MYLSLFLSTSLFAFTPFMVTPDEPTPPPAESEAKPCANFAGQWSGACKVQAEGAEASPKDVKLEIAQHGCEAISIAGQRLAIGGVNKHSVSTHHYTNDNSITVTWSEKRDALRGGIMINGRNFGSCAEGTCGKAHSLFGGGGVHVNLKDGKLMLEQQTDYTIVADGHQKPISKKAVAHCELEKK